MTCKHGIAMFRFAVLLFVLTLCWQGKFTAETSSVCASISSQDALLVASHGGQILYAKNEIMKCVPASTLKILTALATLHHVEKSYRFHTEFYLDADQNLKIKGYGDPLLISEVWRDIATILATKVGRFKNIILDTSYFAPDINIPGIGNSTNPYDAPNVAICANFNTVFFKRDQAGTIVTGEPQTPMTPLALKKIEFLGLHAGRYTLWDSAREAALYAGELFAHFLKEAGNNFQGEIRTGTVNPEDRLIYTHLSPFTMEKTFKKMFEFSSNFIANQILLALGAYVEGPPATLGKGVEVVSRYAKERLHLSDIRIVEGSGISRKNRLSAMDMLAALKAFEPYRGLLTKKGCLLYKSGTLTGVKTRAGYIEGSCGGPHYFVIFLNNSGEDIERVMENIKKGIGCCK